MTTGPNHLRRAALDQCGFSMIAVMLVMMVGSMLVAAAFAAANGDFHLSADSRDRKAAYAAAEAGLNYYEFNLNRDFDYWTHCEKVDAPSATEPSPVNLAGATPRQWRTIPGSTAQYSVELLPARGRAQCVENDPASMLDPDTGGFRIRATGRARDGDPLHRSIVASFRRKSFLDYLYFTDFETLDPAAYATESTRADANRECADKYRGDRGSCTDIQFTDRDRVNGPFHTNDDILVCGGPHFGRDAGDKVEVSGPAPGYRQVCSGSPVFSSPFKAEQDKLFLPPSNKSLEDTATPTYTFVGTTTIRFNDTAGMTVTDNNGSRNLAYPANGVVYVKNDGTCTGNPPIVADYAEPTSCGNAYVSGTYAKSLTLGAENDVIVRPPRGSSNGDLVRSGDALLGLIPNNFARVYHRVTRDALGCRNYDTPAEPLMGDVRIDAAILSLGHSFIVDNYNCGAFLGTLTVNGTIAQKYRGPVGTGSGTTPVTGYVKAYTYDDRLRYRSPPYFLDPIAAAWNVVRTNEQVPAS